MVLITRDLQQLATLTSELKMVLTMTHHFNHKGLSLSQNEQKNQKELYETF